MYLTYKQIEHVYHWKLDKNTLSKKTFRINRTGDIIVRKTILQSF